MNCFFLLSGIIFFVVITGLGGCDKKILPTNSIQAGLKSVHVADIGPCSDNPGCQCDNNTPIDPNCRGTPTFTPTVAPSPSLTPIPSPNSTVTPTTSITSLPNTPTFTPTPNSTDTPTIPPTNTPTFTFTFTLTPVSTNTPTIPPTQIFTPTPNATICIGCDIDFQNQSNEDNHDYQNDLALGTEICQNTSGGCQLCLELCEAADDSIETIKYAGEILIAVYTHVHCRAINNCP